MHTDGTVCEHATGARDCPQQHRWVATSVGIESGIFTANPHSDLERNGMAAYEGDSLGRVLVQPENRSATRSETWFPTVDKLTGKPIEMRRANCGSARCMCATEVRFT
jgi:hypothetical protein